MRAPPEAPLCAAPAGGPTRAWPRSLLKVYMTVMGMVRQSPVCHAWPSFGPAASSSSSPSSSSPPPPRASQGPAPRGRAAAVEPCAMPPPSQPGSPGASPPPPLPPHPSRRSESGMSGSGGPAGSARAASGGRRCGSIPSPRPAPGPAGARPRTRARPRPPRCAAARPSRARCLRRSRRLKRTTLGRDVGGPASVQILAHKRDQRMPGSAAGGW